MKVLGIDLGRRRIGLALGDTEAKIVVGLATIINNRQTFDTINEIVCRENITKLIIGLPRTLNGQLGGQADYTQKWAADLIKATGLAVVYADERLSSRMARNSLAAIGSKLAKEDIDQAAAVLILQGYLDKLNSD